MAKSKRLLLILILAVFCICGFSAYAFTDSFTVNAINRVDYVVYLDTYTIADFSSDITVKDPDGDTVQTQGSFNCDKLGRYSVCKNGKILYFVEVIFEPFKATFTYASDLDGVVYAGETLILPSAEISTELEKFDNYNVEILSDGVSVRKYENVSSDIAFYFNESGDYDVVYYVVDRFDYTLTDVHQVSVLSKKLIVNAKIPSEWSVLYPMDISAVAGFYEGVFYGVDVSVSEPDGNVYTITGDFFTPSKQGLHTITFSSVVSGTTVEKTCTVNVDLSQISIFSGGKNIQSVIPSSETAADTGVEIAVSGSGASIYYNKVINLAEFTKNDSLISFYCKYEGEDSVNTKRIRVKLTDAYDPSNSISVYWWRNTASPDDTYMLAEFNGYALGINNEKTNWTGELGKPRETYGTIVKENMYKRTNPLNFSYDREENAIYSIFSGKTQLVLDLDDADALGSTREIWRGFSSDYIYLSFDFIDNITSVLQIQSIGNDNFVYGTTDIYDENYLRFNYNDKTISGETDVNYIGDEIEAYVNYICRLPIPETNDVLFGDISVSFNVLKYNQGGYQTVSGIDGYSFVPIESGSYKAVYTYNDKYGSVLSKEFSFDVSGANPPEIIIESQNITADIMSYCALPAMSVSGGVKGVDKNVSLFYNGVPVQADERILLDKTGEVKIIVNAADFIGQQKTEEFTITVNRDKRIISIAEQPLTFIAGREYVLPDFTAIDYSVDKGASGYYMEKTVKVGSSTIGSDLKYTPSYNDDYITIEYFGGYGTSKQVCEKLTVRVISNGNQSIPFEKYFDYNATKTTATLFEYGMCFDISNSDVISLPNPIPVNAFSFEFSLLKNKLPDSVKVVLTDYINSEQQIEIVFDGFEQLSAGLSNISSNGKILSSLKYLEDVYQYGSKQGTGYFATQIQLSNNGAFVYDSKDSLLCEITEYVNGKIFAGFDSGLVITKIYVNNPSSCSFVLAGIANQSVSKYSFKNNRDVSGPALAPDYALKIRYPYGTVLTIPKAVAYDVLQGKVKSGIALNITKPDGSVVSYDGSVDNLLSLNMYGIYTFTYSAIDYLGNSAEYEYSINVYDNVCPNIVIQGSVRTTYKVGETLKLPVFTATDNVKIVRSEMLLQDTASRIAVAESNYKFEKAGKYKIIVFASDSEGNSAKAVYEIIVSE